MSDYDEFRKVMAWLFALYPGAQLGASTTEAWWSLLSDYPPSLIRSSARRMVAQREETRFPPTAPELLAYVKADAKIPQKRPGGALPELPEATLETSLGAEHPVTMAIASATGPDGTIDSRAALKAIIGLVGGAP